MTTKYEEESDSQLLDHWIGLHEAELYALQQIGEIRAECHRRLLARQASEIAHPKVTCKLDKAVHWDTNQLTRLLDQDIPPEELTKGYAAPHDELVHVPAKWNMTHINTLRKYGGLVKEIIDEARNEYPSGVTISVRGQERNSRWTSKSPITDNAQ